METLIKLRDSKARIAEAVASRYVAPTGVIASHWRRVLAPRVAELAEDFKLSKEGQDLLADLEWRCRATSVVWRTFSAYVRLWHFQTGSGREARHREHTDRLRQRLNELSVTTFGASGLLKASPATTALPDKCDLTVDLNALAPSQKPKNIRASATASNLLSVMNLLRQEFMDAYLVPEAFDRRLDALFGMVPAPVSVPVRLPPPEPQPPATLPSPDAREFQPD